MCATSALRSDVADLVGRLAHLGMLNSRMNDFFDVWFVAGTFSFDAGLLTTRDDAIAATFQRHWLRPESRSLQCTDRRILAYPIASGAGAGCDRSAVDLNLHSIGTTQNINRKPNRKYLGSMSRPSGFTLVIVSYPLRSFTVPAEVNCRFDTLDAGLLK